MEILISHFRNRRVDITLKIGLFAKIRHRASPRSVNVTVQI